MVESPVRVWVSLGSNIAPMLHIRQALDDLRDEFGEFCDDLNLDAVLEPAKD